MESSVADAQHVQEDQQEVEEVELAGSDEYASTAQQSGRKRGRKQDPLRAQFTRPAGAKYCPLTKRWPEQCRHCDRKFTAGNAKIENLRKHLLQQQMVPHPFELARLMHEGAPLPGSVEDGA